MKLPTLVLTCAMATAALVLPAHALEAGALAPDLVLPGLKDTVSLAQFKGKVVYLDFWASWCGPCKQSFPFMNELQAKYGRQGLQIVAVNLDAKRADALSFLAEVPAQFTIALDAKGDSARHFDVKAMPSSLIVGRDGKVLTLHRGFRGDDRMALEQQIQAALGTP